MKDVNNENAEDAYNKVVNEINVPNCGGDVFDSIDDAENAMDEIMADW